MLTVIAAFASDPVAGPSVDWVARGTAVAGLLLSIVALARLILEAQTKRATNVPSDLRSTVEELLNALSSVQQRPERIEQLNTPKSQVEVERLGALPAQLADRRLARNVRDFHRAVLAARVQTSPSEPVILTHAQSESVERAVRAARVVRVRLDKLAKRTQS